MDFWGDMKTEMTQQGFKGAEIETACHNRTQNFADNLLPLDRVAQSKVLLFINETMEFITLDPEER